MVHFMTVDATTASVNSSTILHNISLTDGFFGLQEYQWTMVFPPRNGNSWTVSVQTSDLAAVTLTIVLLSFAIDHYFFKSQYLVHIHGVTRPQHHATIQDEEALNHEEKPFKLESGQKSVNAGDSNSKPEPEAESDASASPIHPIWINRVFNVLFILMVIFFLSGKSKKHDDASQVDTTTQACSTTKAEAEREVKKPPPTDLWGKCIKHPWSQKLVRWAVLVGLFLVILVVFTYNVLYWPFLLILFILEQCVMYGALEPKATIPWQSIALKSTLYFIVFTTIGATLLLKPNRWLAKFWKYLKWTHAVNWWLFWSIWQSPAFANIVIKWTASYFTIQFYSGSTSMAFMAFIVRPALVAYLYSGALCDAVAAVRYCTYIWKNMDNGIFSEVRT
ncbi:hypothetical protein MMC25_005353 [Agyrium rufum]|nr:hypothetical protein [Agyrium rufum]